MQLLECRLVIDDLDAFVTELGAIGDRHGVTIQAFDARNVADRQHLERAVDLADRAIERDENVARDRAIELLLYAAGRRQIDRAFEMGLTAGPGTQAAVILIAGRPDRESESESESDREDAAIDELAALDSVVSVEPTLDASDPKTLCAFFEITDVERSATDAPLGALVRERVALLDVEK